jgi:hypothetical protein
MRRSQLFGRRNRGARGCNDNAAPGVFVALLLGGHATRIMEGSRMVRELVPRFDLMLDA